MLSAQATPRYSGYSHGKGWNERPFKPQIGRNPTFCPKNFPDLKFLGFFFGPPPSQTMPEAPPGAGTGTSQPLLPKKKKNNLSPAFPGISQPSLFLKLRLFPTFSLKEKEGFALFRQRQGEAAPKTSAQPQFWGIFQPIWEIREALWSPKIAIDPPQTARTRLPPLPIPPGIIPQVLKTGKKKVEKGWFF